MCRQNRISSSVATLHGVIFGWRVAGAAFRVSMENIMRPIQFNFDFEHKWLSASNTLMVYDVKFKLVPHQTTVFRPNAKISSTNSRPKCASARIHCAPPLHYRINSQIGFRFSDREIFYLDMNSEWHNRILKSALFTNVAPLHRVSTTFNENGCTTVKCVHRTRMILDA